MTKTLIFLVCYTLCSPGARAARTTRAPVSLTKRVKRACTRAILYTPGCTSPGPRQSKILNTRRSRQWRISRHLKTREARILVPQRFSTLVLLHPTDENRLTTGRNHGLGKSPNCLTPGGHAPPSIYIIDRPSTPGGECQTFTLQSRPRGTLQPRSRMS